MARGYVLLVDDDDEILDAVSDVLRDVGYVVEVAHDGVEALATLADGQPCLVLLDLMMPEMNGWQLLDYLRDHGMRVGVCILTASPQAAPRELPILRKPFELEALLDIVARHCGRPIP
jgi:CheY-like chemotaxis protein